MRRFRITQQEPEHTMDLIVSNPPSLPACIQTFGGSKGRRPSYRYVGIRRIDRGVKNYSSRTDVSASSCPSRKAWTSWTWPNSTVCLSAPRRVKRSRANRETGYDRIRISFWRHDRRGDHHPEEDNSFSAQYVRLTEDYHQPAVTCSRRSLKRMPNASSSSRIGR